MSANREILMKFITGQNEKVKQDISMQGYKDSSPYRNNPSNTIYGTPQGTSITMQGVSTPLVGIDEFGNKQNMFPGQNYQFPGTRVIETRMAKYGGLLNKTIKCSNCGWSWKAADGGNDVGTCHKCGNENKVMQQGGENMYTTSGNPVIIPSEGSYPLSYRDRGDRDADGTLFSAAKKVSRVDENGKPLTRNQIAENQIMWNAQKQAYSPGQQAFNIWKNNEENTKQGYFIPQEYNELVEERNSQPDVPRYEIRTAKDDRELAKESDTGGGPGFFDVIGQIFTEKPGCIYTDEDKSGVKKRDGGLTTYQKAGKVKPNSDMSYEDMLDKFLGNPQEKSREDAAALIFDEELDNVRHASAGRYTTKAIADKTNPLLGFLGSNALGVAHEISTAFKPTVKDNRPISSQIRESAEDIFNNGVGSFIELLPMTDAAKTRTIQKLSVGNLLPDGIDSPDGENFYIKDQKGKVNRSYRNDFQNGGDYTGNWFKNADVMSVSNKYQEAGTVKYGTPEYEEAYNRGEVVTEDGQRSPILLDEVTIQNNYKRPRGFWEQSRDKYLKDNADASLLGAIGSVVKYPASVGQHALTYATTGKVQDPSEAWGHNTKEGWFDSPSAFGRNLDDTLLNAFADPANLIGAGILTKENILSKLGKVRNIPTSVAPELLQGLRTAGQSSVSSVDNAQNAVTGAFSNMVKPTAKQLENAKRFLPRRQFIKKLQEEGLIGKDFNYGDLNYAARFNEKTDALTKLALERRHTGFRNVSGELPIGGIGEQDYTGRGFNMNKPAWRQEISEFENMRNAGVDFNDPKSIAEYQAAHIPLEDYGYRSTGEGSNPDYGFLFRSSHPVSSKQYGSYQFKSKPNLDFTSGNYSDWFKKYFQDLDYHLRPTDKYNFRARDTNVDDMSKTVMWKPSKEPSVGNATLVGPRGSKAFEIDKEFPFENLGELNSEQFEALKKYRENFTRQYNTGWRGEFKQGGLTKYDIGGTIGNMFILEKFLSNNQLPKAQLGKIVPRDERMMAVATKDNTRNFKPKVGVQLTPQQIEQRRVQALIDKQGTIQNVPGVQRGIDRRKSSANPLNQKFAVSLNPENWTRENMAESAKGLESQFRVSDEPNVFDDYINPASWIGKMAANLGQAPLRAQQEDSYTPYVEAIGEPLVAGAVGEVLDPYISKALGYVARPVKNALAKIGNKNTFVPIRDANINSIDFNNPINNLATTFKNRNKKLITVGAENLDKELLSKISQLESPEGFNRLVAQEAEMLKRDFSQLEKPLLKTLVGDIDQMAIKNAHTRISELYKTALEGNFNANYLQAKKLNPNLTPQEFGIPVNNAFFRQGTNSRNFSDNVINLSKEPSMRNDIFSKTYYQAEMPGEIAIGREYAEGMPVYDHEINHALQNGRNTVLDDQLRQHFSNSENLSQDLSKKTNKAYSYFRKSKQGVPSKEPSSFLAEVRRSMLDRGLIKDIYETITPKKVFEAMKHFKMQPNINPYTEQSYHRIFDFADMSPKNIRFLADSFNKLPGVIPISLGVGAASQIPTDEQSVPGMKNGGDLSSPYNDMTGFDRMAIEELGGMLYANVNNKLPHEQSMAKYLAPGKTVIDFMKRKVVGGPVPFDEYYRENIINPRNKL
jgi:hypothetical protein